MTNKFIVKSTYDGTTVAGLSKVGLDTDSSHFSFAIYVNEEEFCQGLDKLIANSLDNDKYHIPDEVIIHSSYVYDVTRLVRDCSSVHITRGNLKVMYSGHTGSLIGLTKVIRKAVKTRDDKFDKENT